MVNFSAVELDCIPSSRATSYVSLTFHYRQLTLLSHADVPAAQKTTRLTLAAHPHVHLTAASVLAHVLSTAGDAATEETFTDTQTHLTSCTQTTTVTCGNVTLKQKLFKTTVNLHQLEMWANAQRDGRPAEHRWRPLFNAAKFG